MVRTSPDYRHNATMKWSAVTAGLPAGLGPVSEGARGIDDTLDRRRQRQLSAQWAQRAVQSPELRGHFLFNKPF